MPAAYSYIRFSTVEPIRGDSLRCQRKASAKYAADYGLTLDPSLNVRDLGVSAFTGSNIERGALGQFVAAIDERRVQPDSYLLVASLDRLPRLPVTEALAFAVTRQAGSDRALLRCASAERGDSHSSTGADLGDGPNAFTNDRCRNRACGRARGCR
ncbi:recombinase family protein [Ralstonia pseudosolanacearum]|uniref:recombinase family protein n=1 Tax=Ralstonia pseudosolanacearum TaxID=1310165 RepID=UPI00399D7418